MEIKDLDNAVNYLLNKARDTFPMPCTVNETDIKHIFERKAGSQEVWAEWTNSLLALIGWLMRNQYLRGNYKNNGYGKFWATYEITDTGLDFMDIGNTPLSAMLRNRVYKEEYGIEDEDGGY